MKSATRTKKASLALLSLFIGAAAWAQEASTINYFVSPEAKVEGKSWHGNDVSGNAVVAENQDYTTIKAEGGKVYYEYIYMPNLAETGGYKISDIKSFSITTRQDPTSNAQSNAYINIYTQKIEGSSSPSWYESRLNVEPYYAGNYDKYTGAGNWYTWSTENTGDNAYITVYDSTPNRGGNGSGFQGAMGFGSTWNELQNGAVSITNPSDPSYVRDYSSEKVWGVSINVNDTQNNMSNPGIDIKSFNMNLAGQDYAWNFLGEGSTWNVTSGNQVAADKISGMTVNVSGEGTTLTTQAGLSNSFVNVSNSGTANISDAALSGMETTAEWGNGQNYSSKPLFSVSSSGNLNISESEFSDNKVTHTGSPNSGVGAQGIISLSDASISVSNTTFSNNKSETVPGEVTYSDPTTQGSVLYASNAQSANFSGVNFVNNSAKGVSVQGGAIAGFGGNYSIEGGSFEGNVSDGTAYDESEAYGAAGYFAGNSWSDPKVALNLEVNGTSFKNNQTQGTWAYGGALYVGLGTEGSSFKISDSSFEGNKTVGIEDSLAGALYINGGSATVENTSLNGNSASVGEAGADVSYNGGGALVVRNSNVKISATKDISNVGNYYEINGAKDDSRGGFMFLRGASTVDFDIAEGATYTIGDGTAGQDSIASEAGASSQQVINKTGAGTLTVNSSMANYKGDLNVNEGTLNLGVVPVNTSIANNISVAAGATLNTNYGERATNWMTLQAGKTLDVSGTWQHSYQVGIQEGSTFTLREGGKADLGYLAFGGKAVIEGDLIVGKAAGNEINFGGTTSEEYGKSEMTIQNGGTATFATNVNIGHRKGEDGTSKDAIVNVNEGGTFTVSEGDLNIGSSSRVASDNVSSGEGYFNVNGGSVSVASNINVGTKNTGVLSMDGGSVTASNINIGSFGRMNLTIDSASTAEYQVNSAIANAGELVLQAKLGTSETKNFNIASGGISGEGLVSVYGGVYENNVLTINAKVVNSDITSATTVDAGSIVTINSDSSIESAAKSVSIATSSDSITVNSAALADHNDADFMGEISLASNETLMAAWAFDVLGVDQDNTVVLSFAIGEGLDLSDIGVYQRDGDAWTNVTGDLDALSLSDGILSFIADSMSDYALTVVPEPSTYALIFGALALVFVISRRRK